MINEVFQFLSGGSPALKDIICSVPLPRTTLILDLEDALQNVVAPQLSPALKQKGRNRIREAFQNNFVSDHIGIRINAPGTAEFVHDLQLLEELGPLVSWRCIVIPKTGSVSDINICKEAFKNKGVRCNELIPIVETVKGLEQLKEICSMTPGELFSRIFFGFYDYSLDAGHWPFAEPSDTEYMLLHEKIIARLGSAGYGFIHGAIPHLNDEALLKKIVLRLGSACPQGFGQAALSFRQAKIIATLDVTETEAVPHAGQTGSSFHDKFDRAKNVVRDFEKHIGETQSFYVDGAGSRFVPPQYYLAAKKFLNAHENA